MLDGSTKGGALTGPARSRMGDLDVDSVIERLLEVRGSRPGKQVNLAEHEVKALCIKAREIFMSQPVLLELEAPIKICGKPSCCALLLSPPNRWSHACAAAAFSGLHARRVRLWPMLETGGVSLAASERKPWEAQA